LRLFWAGWLTSAAVIAVTLQGVSASAPIPDPTHPVVMQQAAQAVATSKETALHPFTSAPPLNTAATTSPVPQREVFGFALASSLNDPTVGDPTWNFALLSTVAFFGLHVNDDGTFTSDSGLTVWNSSELTDLVTLAHAHSTKVVVTIIKQDFVAGTPDMCAALTNSTTTVTNTVNEVSAKGVDGVNVDYEGLNGSCGTTDPNWARTHLTSFVAALRAALPVGKYLSIDTYASSAADPAGFFDIPGLAPSVDSFFVMAYDLEYSNYAHPPISCSSLCLGPTAPLTGYYYNDTTTASQYVSAAGASKVILGVPYYGRKSCVTSPTPNQYPTSAVQADTYLNAAGESGSNLVQPGSYATHRDANDPTGQERWDTWVNTSLSCTREFYWDDTAALSHKYALVNSDGLRGVGIWNLNYGGGAPELWCALNNSFTAPGGGVYTGAPTVVDVEASSGRSAGGTSVTITGCKFTGTTAVIFGSTPAASFTVVSDSQITAVSPAHPTGTVTVSITATAGTSVAASSDLFTFAFSGLYTLDAYGGIHPDDAAPISPQPYFGFNIAKTAKPWPGAGTPQAGLVLEGYGGLHPYGSPALQVGQGPYYPGNDIARDFVFLPDGTGGYELDGYGGIHPFSLGSNPMPLPAGQYPYFAGQDVAKKIMLLADGSGGYVLDAFGGLHPWAVTGHALPVGIGAYGYWAGRNIARDIWLAPDSTATSAHGYVLDAYGGFHPFWSSAASPPAPIAVYGYWPGQDIARSMWFMPGSSASSACGYTLDAYGGLHPFEGGMPLPPPIGIYGYWPGRDIAKTVWGA
jgi:spore germination protein YaaH